MPWSPFTLLRPELAEPVLGAVVWRRTLLALEGDGPFALAVSGGRRAGTVGWAFCFGYQAALRSMLPDLTLGRVAALCATEAAGNHPRNIQTRLRDGVLTGNKSFVTLGPLADLLLIIANVGQDDAGRNRLVGCALDAGADGVAVTAMPPLPFVPEVPHGQLTLLNARPTAVVPGDGYTDILKPFRTVEDIHVHAAIAAWLLRVAVDSGWPDDVTEALLVGIAAFGQAAALDPSAPGTHRLVGGALAAFSHLVDRIEPLWADAPPAARDMWARDRALMRIAGNSRKARLNRARDTLRVRSSDGE